MLISEPKPPKLLRLISVVFKEASLDSPTFRASVAHHHRQIEDMERWVETLVSLLRQFPTQVKEFRSFSDTVTDQLVPSFMNEGLVDQVYTFSALVACAEGIRSLWDTVFRVMQITTNEATNELLHICAKDIRDYRKLKTRFDALQLQYDMYLDAYSDHPKTTAPRLLMEDANRVYQARKLYLDASFELVNSVARLSHRLDLALINLARSLWKPAGKAAPVFAKLDDCLSQHPTTVRLNRVGAWRQAYSPTRATIAQAAVAARAQMEKSALARARPSERLEDYDSATISNQSLLEYHESAREKHAYVYMCTSIPGQPGEVWVRRWMFLKDGLLGLLVLAPSRMSVQETDRIGILGCSVRYAPEQARKFCFEVRTGDSRFVFQAETLDGLKSWLKLIAQEKKRLAHADEAERAIASRRHPPLLREFAVSPHTSADAEWTTLKGVAHLSDLILSNAEAMQEFEQLSQPRSVINSPITTDYSHATLLARMFVRPFDVPSALTANVWGSVNWGIYFLMEHQSKRYELETMPLENRLEVVRASHPPRDAVLKVRAYPAAYSPQLRAIDVKMRSLFETVIAEDEVALFEFTTLLSPNPKQELSAAAFVTQHNVYLYSNSVGVVFLAKLAIRELTSVEARQTGAYETLALYDVEGLLVEMKVFLDDSRLLKLKLNALMYDASLDQPLLVDEILVRMKEVEAAISTRPNHIASVAATEAVLQPSDFKMDFTDTGMLLQLDKVYDLPAKGLFHMLFGDSSLILEDVYIHTREREVFRANWRPVAKGALEQITYYAVLLNRSPLGHIRRDSLIEEMVDNRYYSVVVTKGAWTTPFSTAGTIVARYVIHGIDTQHAQLHIYTQSRFAEPGRFDWLTRAFTSFTVMPVSRLIHRRILEGVAAIGPRGKILVAVKMFGKVSVASEQLEVPEVPEAYNQGTRITLSAIIGAVVRQTLVSVVTRVLMGFALLFKILKRLMRGLRLHSLLVALLALSMVGNLFLTGKVANTYWNTRAAVQQFDAFVASAPNYVQRAIYIRDAEELVARTAGLAEGSLCMAKFKEHSFVLNFESLIDWRSAYADFESYSVARSLQQQFQSIGIQRNELLIRLTMLNEMESATAQGEWLNWLISERRRCRDIREKFHISGLADDVGAEALEGMLDLLRYCRSCDSESPVEATVL